MMKMILRTITEYTDDIGLEISVSLDGELVTTQN